MALCINDSGTWRNITTQCVNQSGTWRKVATGCINQSGTWRAFKVNQAWPGGPILGSAACGGIVICGAANIGWILAPSSAEVLRSWYNINDANTRAQQVSGCTGWFVPTCAQGLNPGIACRQYWDTYTSTRYWSSTEFNANYARDIPVCGGNFSISRKDYTKPVRSFRCVSY